MTQNELRMNHAKNNFSCLAVDMGAGSIRIVVGNIKNGIINYTEIHRVANDIHEIDGHDRWDITGMFNEIRIGIDKAISNSTDTPLSIGIDTWGVDFVLLDENGELLDIPIAYRDKRTEGMIEKWKSELSAIETYERTGINFYVFNTLFQLLSMRGSEILNRSKHILFLPSYINYLLSGSISNEQTIASTSQILSINGKEWDPIITEKLGISKNVLGPIVESGKKLGAVTIENIKDLNIENIAVGCHDTACAVASIPAVSPDFVFISSGTWCIVGIESSEPMITKESLDAGFTNERGYGDTFRSLKNIVGLWLIQGLRKSLPEDRSYSELEIMVNDTKQTKQYIDPDDPIFYNPANMKVAFDSFFKKTNQALPQNIAEYMKIAYDSLCFSFRHYIEFLEDHKGKKIDVIHVIGGGCQSDYFNQHIATICEKEVLSGPVEGAVIGNIIIQAISMGHISSIREGREMVRRSFSPKTYTPGKEFEKLKNTYQEFLNYKIKH